MRRRAAPLAAAALVALAALVIVGLARPAVAPSRAEQAAQLAASLRCPDCAGLSVAESSSGSASAIRAEIGRLLDAGQAPEQVRQHFVARYGDWILLSPPLALAWWLPVLVVLAAAMALTAWLLRGRRRIPVAPELDGTGESDARLEQVRREAEALDA
jgi:cytochrome c-type biogenesis protein CcmH